LEFLLQGYQNIIVSFDLRHSNTGPRHFTVQYTTDNAAAVPVWVDFAEDSTTAGDVFVNNRTYNLSAITALNNNANAAFRIVSSFRPGHKPLCCGNLHQQLCSNWYLAFRHGNSKGNINKRR
jgi:hypothetical protein